MKGERIWGDIAIRYFRARFEFFQALFVQQLITAMMTPISDRIWWVLSIPVINHLPLVPTKRKILQKKRIKEAAVDSWINRWGYCSISSRNRPPPPKSHIYQGEIEILLSITHDGMWGWGSDCGWIRMRGGVCSLSPLSLTVTLNIDSIDLRMVTSNSMIHDTLEGQ